MSRLCHALLTEDESVLHAALKPAATDSVLALFAYGNGDAAFSLLQATPSSITAHDVFDYPSLVAQIELKKWLFENLDSDSFRKFVAIDPGFDKVERSTIIASLLADLPAAAREFWLQRSSCLRRGMAAADSTRCWISLLRPAIGIYNRLPRFLQRVMLRLGTPLAWFFFPREERIHSLGYRQLRRRPSDAMAWLTKNSTRPQAPGPIVPYGDFKYLSSEGHAAICENLDRLRLVDTLHPGSGHNKFYLSNLIDYVSDEEFCSILGRILPADDTTWTLFLNSSYNSDSAHPYLKSGIAEGLFDIDWALTKELRANDKVRVYPGLTVLHHVCTRDRYRPHTSRTGNTKE